MAPKPDPDMVKHALAELAKGRSAGEVAAEVSEIAGKRIAPRTVLKWRADAQQPPVPVVSRAPGLTAHLEAKRAAEAQLPPAPAIDVSDTLGTMRTLLEDMLREAHSAKLANPKLAATFATKAGDVLNMILRAEKARAEDDTTLRFSRAEIDETRRGVLERVRVLTSGAAPLCCSECGRRLRVAWGDAQEKVEAARKGGA